MCLLITAPSGIKSVTNKELKNGFNGNPDSTGIAYWDAPSGRMVLKKMLSLKELIRLKKTTLDNVPCIVHFRMATHGTVDTYNCHPFERSNWVMAHNGIISRKELIIPKGKSDTHAYADMLMSMDFHTLAERRLEIEEFVGVGNKLAFFSIDGEEYFIANEKLGHWRDKVWFSNRSYEDFDDYYSCAGGFGFGKDRGKKGRWSSLNPKQWLPAHPEPKPVFDDIDDLFVLVEFDSCTGETYVAYEDMTTGEVGVMPKEEFYEGNGGHDDGFSIEYDEGSYGGDPCGLGKQSTTKGKHPWW